MVIGIIGLSNESGLGRLADDFYNHFDCNILVLNHIKGQDKTKFKNAVYCTGIPTNEEITALARESDLLLTFETPFNPNAYSIFKQFKKPTICVTMYECMQDNQWFWKDVDVFISCSLPDLQEISLKNKIYLPIPIDTERIKFIERSGKIRKILHNAGYMGFQGRNGTTEVIKFMRRYINDDIELKIRGQEEHNLFAYDKSDKRITLEAGEIDFDNLYSWGDLFFFPCRFNGLCLPIQEALASGLPVMTSDLIAWTGLIPKEWQIKTITPNNISYGKFIEVRKIDIDDALVKFEWFKNQDLKKLSHQAREIAEKRSWEVMKPKYEKLFKILL